MRLRRSKGGRCYGRTQTLTRRIGVAAERIEALGAVVPQPGEPMRIEPIHVDPPEAGEVRVRLVASGVCHSDHWAMHNGNWGAPFPMLLGHEGAGIVEQVGEGVAGLAVDDPVLLAWAVPCGTCPPCRQDRPRGCAHAWEQPARLRRGSTGDPLVGTLSLGTLATHTVVNAEQAIRVPDHADLARICLLGCGASTGVGAAVNTAGVWAGATVAVIGLGGIGLSALQGARIAGAGRLIAVDRVASKLELARSFGATDVVDAAAGDPVASVRDLTAGEGVDVAFEATGVPEVVARAVAMCARSGTTVAIGVPPLESDLTLRYSTVGGAAYQRKVSLLIADGGDPLREDFDTWVGWALDGRLNLDDMVTREFQLTEVDLGEAFRAMLAGEVIRSVVRISDP
jgi:Zn-dependent alcohol dehydrogenase